MNSAEQIAFLSTFLDIFSPTLQEEPAVAFLANWMTAQGFAARIDEVGNVIGTIGQGPREIMLLGHIDTVPGYIPVRQEGDLLFGRGSVDAKGPLACFAIAAAMCAIQPDWKVTVAGAVCEEGDSRGAKRIRDTFQPEYCVIGEPSGWDHITLGYKGSAWFDYHIKKTMAHTAAKAESACEAAVQFWNNFQEQIKQFNEGRSRSFDQITTSLRQMNSQSDGFSDTASLSFNLRLPPETSIAQVEEITNLHRGDGELTLLDGIECYRADKNTSLVRSFLAAIRAMSGKPGFVVKTGTSDMNIVGPAWNIPIIAYGPGDSSLDHTPDEHVSVSEFLSGVNVLKTALETLQKS